jgi:hypothetical protein
MSSSIVSPFPFFTDTTGAPLEGGYIYIGQSNLNPETAPVNVFWDAALTIPATNPVRTVGGYPSRQGTPSRFFIQGAFYSITIRNKNHALVFSSQVETAAGTPTSSRVELQTATSGQTTFNLSAINYIPNTNSIQVYRNGLLLLSSDYSETSSTQVVLDTPGAARDQFLFVAAVIAIAPNPTSASFLSQALTATAGQTIFNLTTMTYPNGTGALIVFRNGMALLSGTDFTESTPTRVTLTTGATLGDQLLFLTVKNA